MMTNCRKVIKFLLKSSLDNYILPGTLTGTEILWPYLTQWHRHLGNFTFATIYLFYSRLYLRGLGRMITCQDPVEVLVAANERQDVNDDLK